MRDSLGKFIARFSDGEQLELAQILTADYLANMADAAEHALQTVLAKSLPQVPLSEREQFYYWRNVVAAIKWLRKINLQRGEWFYGKADECYTRSEIATAKGSIKTGGDSDSG